MKNAKAVPIDHGWAWVILLGDFMVAFLVIGCITSFGVFFAEFMVEFKASASSITIALSIQSIVFTLSSLFALSIGSTLASNRTYIVFSGFLGCAAYLISAFMPDISYLILSQGVLFGIAYAFSYGPALVVLGRYFEKKRAIATSLGELGTSFAYLVYPPMVRFLLDTYGLRGALAIVGGILLNLCVAGALMRPITFYRDLQKFAKQEQSNQIWSTNSNICSPKKRSSHDDNVLKRNQSMPSEPRNKCMKKENKINEISICKKIINLKVLRNTLFRMWIPVCFLGIIGCVQIVIFIPPHAKDRQISDSDTTLFFFIVGASHFISKVLLACFLYCNLLSKHTILSISLLITGVSCMFISFYTDFNTMTILCVIYGSFGSVYFSLFPAVLVEFVGLEQLSDAMAINMLIQGLGLSISNPILGFLRDITGSFHATFYLMGTTLIISGAILFLEPICRRIEIRRSAAQTKVDIQPL